MILILNIIILEAHLTGQVKLVKKHWTQFNSTYKINEQSKIVFQNVYKRANDLFIFNPDSLHLMKINRFN